MGRRYEQFSLKERCARRCVRRGQAKLCRCDNRQLIVQTRSREDLNMGLACFVIAAFAEDIISDSRFRSLPAARTLAGGISPRASWQYEKLGYPGR